MLFNTVYVKKNKLFKPVQEFYNVQYRHIFWIYWTRLCTCTLRVSCSMVLDVNKIRCFVFSFVICFPFWLLFIIRPQSTIFQSNCQYRCHHQSEFEPASYTIGNKSVLHVKATIILSTPWYGVNNGNNGLK